MSKPLAHAIPPAPYPPAFDEDRRREVINRLDTFTTAYVEAALWSTTDNSNEQGGDPLDQNYSIDNLALPTLVAVERDCTAFQKDNAKLLEKAYAEGSGRNKSSYDETSAGHDFWLTRAGHGAGFWDGDLPEKIGDALTEASNGFGEVDWYVGDDGLIYQGGDEQLANEANEASAPNTTIAQDFTSPDDGLKHASHSGYTHFTKVHRTITVYGPAADGLTTVARMYRRKGKYHFTAPKLSKRAIPKRAKPIAPEPDHKVEHTGEYHGVTYKIFSDYRDKDGTYSLLIEGGAHNGGAGWHQDGFKSIDEAETAAKTAIDAHPAHYGADGERTIPTSHAHAPSEAACGCPNAPPGENPVGSLYDQVRPGDRVTIVDRFGKQASGRAVMLGPAGWVLNMGGRHGTPAIASPENIVAVKQAPGERRPRRSIGAPLERSDDVAPAGGYRTQYMPENEAWALIYQERVVELFVGDTGESEANEAARTRSQEASVDETPVDEAPPAIIEAQARHVRAPGESVNVFWKNIPPTARVIDNGKSYEVILPGGTHGLVYWGGQDAREAQRWLKTRAQADAHKRTLNAPRRAGAPLQAEERGLVWLQRPDGVYWANGTGGTFWLTPTASGDYQTNWTAVDGDQQDLGLHPYATAVQVAGHFDPVKGQQEYAAAPERRTVDVVVEVHQNVHRFGDYGVDPNDVGKPSRGLYYHVSTRSYRDLVSPAVLGRGGSQEAAISDFVRRANLEHPDLHLQRSEVNVIETRDKSGGARAPARAGADLPDDLKPIIGTLSHNKDFTVQDLREYTQHDRPHIATHAKALVDKMVRIGYLKMTPARGRYYPTTEGWAWIEGTSEPPTPEGSPNRPIGPADRHGMTIAQAKAILAPLGIVLSKKDEEYRVNFRGGGESSAYYTNDIEDAVASGQHMSREGQHRSKSGRFMAPDARAHGTPPAPYPSELNPDEPHDRRIRTTFSRITPAGEDEYPDTEDGWIDEEGTSMELEDFEREDGETTVVDKAVKFLQNEGTIEASGSHFHVGTWYSTEYSVTDYSTGEEEQRSFHLVGFTPAEEEAIWNGMGFGNRGYARAPKRRHARAMTLSPRMHWRVVESDRQWGGHWLGTSRYVDADIYLQPDGKYEVVTSDGLNTDWAAFDSLVEAQRHAERLSDRAHAAKQAGGRGTIRAQPVNAPRSKRGSERGVEAPHGRPFDAEAPVTPIGLHRATNAMGKLDPETRARLERVLDDPNEETWNDAKDVIIGPPGRGSLGGTTLWQAVTRADPTFPRRGPVRGQPWDRIPSQELLIKAINMATMPAARAEAPHQPPRRKHGTMFIALRDTQAVNSPIVLPKGARVEGCEDTAGGALPTGYLLLLSDFGDAYSGLHFTLADFRHA